MKLKAITDFSNEELDFIGLEVEEDIEENKDKQSIIDDIRKRYEMKEEDIDMMINEIKGEKNGN